MADRRTVYRICTLCEATCGIAVEVEGDRIITIRGDKDDPFSKGYICPKAYGMKGLHDDPDRLRHPIRKTDAGTWEEISWDEAYAYVGERLVAIREESGPNALATYFGNPSAHNLHCMVYLPVYNRSTGSKQRFSASTADQIPKMVSAGLMFGGGLTIPVPDLDRTEHLIILGGNPLASNGSLMTAPDVPGRLKAIVERGGQVIVIDPRRSETADIATEHHFIRPGTDAYLLLAMVHTMFAEDLVTLGRTEGHISGLDAVRDAVAPFAPETVAERCGIDADTIRRLTRDFCAADKAACYGRIGTTCQQFGTLASWAVDLVNILSGHLDRAGCAMFAQAAAVSGIGFEQEPGGKGVSLHRWKSRVRELPEVFGEIPVATLADEIETPGDGQIRALVTVAGNPALSAPNADRLDEAFAALDFMVSVDFYLNETTRHADVILPPTGALEHDTYDLALYQLAVRDVAKYSAPVFEKPEGTQHDWEILARLASYMVGMSEMDLKGVDDFVLQQAVQQEIPTEGGRWEGLTADEAIAKLGDEPGPHRILDLLLRTGVYGDGFGRNPDGLSLQKLKDNPHGIDLGALKEQLPGKLGTTNAKIDLAPDLVLEDLARLRADLENGHDGMVLIGRRHLRSNNSWCHNLHSLVKGPDRCTLMVSEADALRLQLETGGRARVTSRVGSVVAPIEVTDELMPGVVSLPHGWGHDGEGLRMPIAEAHAGVNSNILTDDAEMDVPSGNAVLNGIPVTVEPLS